MFSYFLFLLQFKGNIYQPTPLQDALQLLRVDLRSVRSAEQHGRLHRAGHVQGQVRRDQDQERGLPQAHHRRGRCVQVLGGGREHDRRRQEVDRRLRLQDHPAGDEVLEEGLPCRFWQVQEGGGQLGGVHHDLQPGLVVGVQLESERHSYKYK